MATIVRSIELERDGEGREGREEGGGGERRGEEERGGGEGREEEGRGSEERSFHTHTFMSTWGAGHKAIYISRHAIGLCVVCLLPF